MQGTDTRNVDTVFVGGQVRKWRGELVGVDIGGFPAGLRVAGYVAARAGFSVDPVTAPRREIQVLRGYFASRERQ